jgi:hypothetical protein
MAQGLIVATDVIAQTNEDQHLVAALEQVQEQFDLKSAPPAVLADGLMGTGANLEALDERGVTLYSPTSKPAAAENPAVRPDPTQPVPPAQWERLPLKKIGGRGKQKATGSESRSVSQAARRARRADGDARGASEVRPALFPGGASVRGDQAAVRRAQSALAWLGAGAHGMALAGHGIQLGAADVPDDAESGRSCAGITIPFTLDRVRPIDSRPNSFPCRVAHQRHGGQGGYKLIALVKNKIDRPSRWPLAYYLEFGICNSHC